MKADTLLKKTTATLGAAVLLVAIGCTTHRAVDTTAQTTGEIRTEQASQNQATPDQTLGTAAAPVNTQGAMAPTAPAVISGPAAVDKSGNLYSSSAVGSAGNASGTGLNTNVNIASQRPASESSVTVTQAPATTVATTPAPVVIETPAPAPVVVETTPAPVVIETPAPAPVVTTETVPMTSSTQTTTTTTETTTQTTHKRMRKD